MSDKICIARIVSAHGIKGEVKIKSFTENPEDLLKYKNLTDEYGNQFVLIKRGIMKDMFIIQIEGVTDRNTSESLVGRDLFIAKDLLPPTNQEEYYYNDLIGLKIHDVNQNILGFIKAIHNFGAGHLVEIEFNEPSNNNIFPFTKSYFPEVNLKEKYVTFTQINDIK